MPKNQKSRGPSQRMLRVGELVRHAISDLLARGEVADPELDGVMVTVPEVRMTSDLKLASVYVLPLGGEGADKIVAALTRNKKFIRGELGHRVDMRFTPDLRFFVDTTFDEASRIDALLKSDKVRQDLEKPRDDDPQDED
ncbi:30S ribosome-binding factor RbfA [Cucumibacter marinus]|uniref:30S ribosome-binding factor RbfA n=1 Tax=Cucumibacter marinus TaxID=1121252 RepID=UPI00048F9629|nr:30S ribosome-binding factor RbfA [Cucumibacter marinus]